MANEIKDLEAPAGSLGDVIAKLTEEHGNGLDRVRSVLAMRMNQYNDISLTKDDIGKIAKAFMAIEGIGSSSSLVMLCDKAKCPYKDKCPVYGSTACPEGRECLHENKILSVTMDNYLTSLEVNLDNYPEMVMINQLVEYELIEYRCNAILSNSHRDMKMRSIAGVDADGNVIYKEEISHALQIKMMAYKNKIQLLQELTATRKEKYKKQAALKESKDGQTKMISSMKAKLSELKTRNIEVEDVHDELKALEDLDELGDL